MGSSAKSKHRFSFSGYGSKAQLSLQGEDEEEEKLCGAFKRALSESNLNLMLDPITADETGDWLNSRVELDRAIMETDEGSGGGNGGSRIAGGGGRGNPWESFGADSNSTDVYYQKMLESNPGDPLLLSNYAKFLHEVQYDMDKAEEYYGRAVLASPGDGEILSLYARFIWEIRRDIARAKKYFERAVELASEDCYVVASYAHFLWNSEEEEDENGLSVTSQTHYSSVTAVVA